MEPSSWDIKNNPLCLRVIKTARDIDSINKYSKNGYITLNRNVYYSPLVGKQSSQSKKVDSSKAERNILLKIIKKVTDNIYHFFYRFKSPQSAYLIPNDLFIGQKVFIEDLIEDFVGASTIINSVKTLNRASCAEAIWNGKDLEIFAPLVETRVIH